MSLVKITQLPLISTINANTANTLFVGVDVPSLTTGKMTVTTLAAGLYSNNALVVGQNPILFSNTIAQFSGSDPEFTQVNLQNFNPAGSGDYIVTADTGTNANSYIDLGLGNSTQTGNNAGFNALASYDGYLYVQGPSNTGAQGNLIIGTATANANIFFVTGGVGTLNANDIVAWISDDSFVLNTTSYLTFGDGTVQSTAAASNAYTQAAFIKANTALQNTSTITVNNSIVVPGNITIYGTETRYGNTVTYGNTTWNGAITANNNFTANGIVTFNANTTFNGNTTHNGNTIFIGGITSYGPRISNGDSFFNGNVTANGITTLNGNTFVTGNTTFTGPLTNNGNTYNNGTTYNNGITYLSGTILPTSNNISLGSPSAPFQNIYLSNSTILFTNANATITGTLTVGTIFISNNSIYSSNTQQDINFGQLAATANINMNRVTIFNKDVYANGNVWANSTSVTANTLYSNTFVYGSGSASSVVTQTTSRTTTVTANGISGQIIGYAASALTHQTGYVFTVNNNQILHTSDIVVVSVQSSNCPLPQVTVANTRVGSFDVAVYNASQPGNDAAYTMNLNFAVIRVGS